MKIITVLFALGLALSMLAGCSSANHTGGEFTFQAKIIELDGVAVTVEPLEGEDILRSSDRITFGRSGLDDIGASVGNTVNILYIGGVRESYPAQIDAKSWSLLEASPAVDGDSANMPVAYATYETADPFGTGDGAQLNGMLRQRGDCIVVETEEGTDVLPIFPDDVTTWDETAGALIIDGKEYPLNSQLALGGGYTSQTRETYTVPKSYNGTAEAFIVTSAAFLVRLHDVDFEMRQGSPEQSAMEMRVLEALDDGYPKGAAWDIESNTIAVTVFTNGEVLSDETLRDYEQRAGEIADGIKIAIKTDSGSAPSTD